MSDSIPQVSIPSSDPIHPIFYFQPDNNGWVTDAEVGLLYCVPPECRASLYSPALLTIPLTSNVRSVSLDSTDCALGSSWTQVLECAQP